MGFDWGSLISGVGGIMGASGQGEANAAAAMMQRDQAKREAYEDKRRFEARREAYNNMISSAKGDFGAGETGFNKEANQSLPELAMMEEQIRSGGSEALQDTARQMQLGIAQQGQRGGQAATQLRRGLGDVGKSTLESINKMKFDEANQRAAERRQFQAGKAARGQTASYTPPTF